ncbi:MAG: hypothetical protein Q4C76_10205 [Bacillota bacterium]|nr:hypothetical protein [Bacillota bacterium]
MNTNEMNVSQEEVTMARGEDALLTEDVRQGLETARDSLEYQAQAVLVPEEIQAMTLAEVDAALAREEAAIQELQDKRLAMEPPFRALTRQTLLLKSRKKLEECARTKAEAHALSLQMAALREEELDHQEVRDQLLERKKELQG